MKKTFKYKIIPLYNSEQTALLWLDLCRHLYNCSLEQRILAWRDGHISFYYEQNRELPELKKLFPEYSEIYSQVLQDVLRRLDKAYNKFFNCAKSKYGKVGFPRFKGKNGLRSFTYPQGGFTIRDNHLICSKLGEFKIRMHRPIEGKIKTCTIIHRSTGEWFACFSCDFVPENILPKTGKSVGIDVGLSHLAVDSDGKITDAPRFFRQQERYLRRCQRSLARKNKGSMNREKARIKVAKVHQKITNQRNDFVYKLANHYVHNYDEISVEDLRIKNMMRNKHLSKSFMDAALGIFLNILACKAENAGKVFHKKDPRGTTTDCRMCGHKNKMPLSKRIFDCENCGYKEHRDVHSSKNIKNKPVRARSVERNVAAVMARAQEAQVS